MLGSCFYALLTLLSGIALAEAPLDFAAFVRLVERDHPAAAIAKTTAERAQQAEERSGTLPDPEIALTRQYVPIAGAGTGMEATANAPMWQVTLSQSLPWPGTSGAEAAAARAAREGSGTDADMAAVVRRLAAETLFIDMVRLADAGAFERASIEDADAILKSAADRIRNAVGSHHDLVQAQNAKAVHTLNLAALEADESNLQDHAAQMLGLDSSQGLAFVLHLPDQYSGASAAPLTGGVDLVRLRRQQSHDETTSRLNAERQRSLPHLTAAGMLMRQDDGMQSVGVMAGVSVPVFSGRIRGSLDAEHAAVQAQTDQEVAWHDRTKQLALRQNARRLSVLSQTLRVLRGEIVPNAKQHLAAVVSDYALGRAGFAAANTAREQLLQFEFAAANTLQAHARAVVDQERILAGFVDVGIDQATPQVLGNMAGQGGGSDMGSGTAGGGSAAPKRSGERPPPAASGRGAPTPPQDEPPAPGSGMGGM